MKKHLVFWTMIGVLSIFLAAYPHTAATGTGSDQSKEHQHDSSGMMEQCEAMMTKHESLKAEIVSYDARLDELVAEMNSLHGEGRIDIIAETLTELTRQQKSLRSKMLHFQPQMTQHMMEHMQSGAGASPSSMAMCPMMKGTMDDPGSQEESDGDGHKSHGHH